ISILIPGRMYARAYQDKGLHSKNLSRALEDGGTLTSPFVPWNTCGVFILATLAVHPFAYAPYAVLNYTVPVIGIIMGLIGYKVQFLTKAEVDELKVKEQRMNNENGLTEGV
ncbi:MAG: Na+/H+ antiporter NhaC family protein, partial [Planococcus donghaensis]